MKTPPDVWNCFVLVMFIYLECYAAGSDVPRRRRDNPTCAKKFCEIELHTACLPQSKDVKTGGISMDDQNTIVDYHNRLRGLVQPTATDMLKMTWDGELAMLAQRWSDNCVIKHDPANRRDIPGRMPVGQNLGYNYTSWTDVIKAWYDERDHYDFNAGAAVGNKVIGHYTQLVWADSNKIGCGFSVCGVTKFYACNYGPAGNFVGGRPYTSGKACGSCPGHCSSNLCDCGTNVCGNGGEMNMTTCSCECKLSFYIGDQCKLDCDSVAEPFYCGDGQFNAAGCSQISTVRQHCPNLCGICPYGGYKNSAPDVPIKECSGNTGQPGGGESKNPDNGESKKNGSVVGESKNPNSGTDLRSNTSLASAVVIFFVILNL
ncbi:hypothetical protein ScPMuIL_015106 [Solemya velum]